MTDHLLKVSQVSTRSVADPFGGWPASRPTAIQGPIEMESDDVVLEVKGLRVEFRTKRGVGRAVNDVSFVLRRGETLGLVGESGSGKTVTAMSILGLHPKPAAHIVGGSVIFEGRDLVTLPAGELRRYRGSKISLIPQDPMTSLNPVFTVGSQIAEALELHTTLRGAALEERAVELLSLLQISSPRDRLASYPHQLSGGMRQRVVGAIALAGQPNVVIADEPTTALDATVQAAYLELLRELQKVTGTAILFITHDFGVVADLCHRVAVMYGGHIVETAPTDELFDRPAHPYTHALISSVPDLDAVPNRLPSIEGQPPSIYDLPSGCPFRTRCWLYQSLGSPERCRDEMPPLRSVGKEQAASCHYSEKLGERTMIASGQGDA